MSLRVRLAVLVAAVVAAVVATEGYLEIRMFQRNVQDDFLQTASRTAQAVADDLELRTGQDQTAQVHALLHEFLGTAPTVQDIAVLMTAGDALTLVARTSSAAVDDVLPVARQAMQRNQQTWSGGGQQRVVATPIARLGKVVGAVAVTLSLAPVEQLAVRGREVTLLFAIPAIVLLTVLVDLLAQRLVHRPITNIRQTMRRAGAGELGARAPVARSDEIGEVAGGLNEMLGRLEQLQAELQARVDDATRELRETNVELVDSHQRVLSLRAALAQAEQKAALGQMAANVAHQIGTPLNLVSGYVQVMIEESQGDARAFHRLQTVEAQIRKVTNAVRTMLDFARRPALQREAVDLAALVEQVCEISRPALHAASVEVRVDVRAPLPSVSADPVQLELALLNLVSNSLDAMPAGGRLDISLSANNDRVRVVVADSGTGIPADLLPRIFDPWVTSKPAGRGTGLGLNITREVVASHGGAITVRSEAGQGAVFTIDLPTTL